jgi:hypothetical protein
VSGTDGPGGDPGAPPPVLLSLDIDGTLEAGDPPGPLPLAVVRELQRYGLLIGSASDRTIAVQRAMWQAAGIVPAFLSHKHDLPANTAALPATRRVHIGDTDTDSYYARLAGFEFIHVTALPAVVTAEWVARAVIAGELG